jgi:hypothetical protein
MFGKDLLLVSGRRGAVRSVASTRSGEWRALVHFMSEKHCRTSEGAARDAPETTSADRFAAVFDRVRIAAPVFH